jgi:hypothetical protein
MNKAERTFNPETGRILPDLTNTKGKRKMANENGTVKRTKGNRIQIAYVDGNGAEGKSPMEGVVALKAFLPITGETEWLRLNELAPEILMRLAAFGGATLGRNEVNTTPEGEEDEAAGALRGRWGGFAQGVYRSISTGSATPLILLALERALREREPDAEKVSAKVSEYRALYDAGETEDEQKKARAEVSRLLRAKTPIRAAEEAIKRERAEARLANAKGSDDLSDI